MATIRVMANDIHPLRAYRERQDPPLTQDALAELLGVSKAAVSRWESGIRKPDETACRVIREKTGISVRKLRPDLVELLATERGAA